MAKLQWGRTEDKVYRTGVDRGVIYIQNQDGSYANGIAWSGLESVEVTPEGGEAKSKYADNQVFFNLRAAVKFKATIKALSYPEEFLQCMGYKKISTGAVVGQQTHRAFGFTYRTLLGNETVGTDLGYELHIIYGCTARPTSLTATTVNETPDAQAFSWTVDASGVKVGDDALSAFSEIIVDTRTLKQSTLEELEGLLYGKEDAEAKLPSPEEILTILKK